MVSLEQISTIVLDAQCGPRRPGRHPRRRLHGHAGPPHGQAGHGEAFLDGVIDHGAHFCTYLLGTDMEMNTPDGLRAHELGDRLRRLASRRPVWDTLRVLPWLEKTALVLADAIDEETGEEIPVSPRTILKRQVERAAELGLHDHGRLGVRVLPAQGHLRGGAREGLRGPRAVRLTTTRTTTCSRRPRPSRSTALLRN